MNLSLIWGDFDCLDHSLTGITAFEPAVVGALRFSDLQYGSGVWEAIRRGSPTSDPMLHMGICYAGSQDRLSSKHSQAIAPVVNHRYSGGLAKDQSLGI